MLETAELLFILNANFPFCSQLCLKAETYSSCKLSFFLPYLTILKKHYTHKVLIGRIHLVFSCECPTLTYIPIVLQENNTCRKANSLIVNCISTTKVAAQIFLNETMGKIKDDAYGYSYTVVVVFGILGNILVILSILRQKKNMLKNDYYFLVLHLAICDLQAALIRHIFYIVDIFWLEEPLSDHSPMITCNIYVIGNAFECTGVGVIILLNPPQ